MTTRTLPTAYAVVLPPPDGRAIPVEPRLTRIAYGLWPAGFSGEVVGVIIDAGTGTTEADILAALQVTRLDPAFDYQIGFAVSDHVQCELDRLRAESSERDDDAELAEELAAMSPEDRAIAERIVDLPLEEPPEGYIDRAVDRARREGALPPNPVGRVNLWAAE